ncbi:MAG: GMC family oxidoreductase N-terminal domain-containing protein [Hyphomicrobiaceae bacterium]
MARLARPVGELRADYDAVVVGSGYGGGVAASRLARAGLKVAVLERGKEFLPGEFPSSLLASQREMQISAAGRRIGADDALFDLRLGRDVHAMMACGLGGTSLINANVCLSPDMLVFEDERWPAALRTDHYLSVGFGRAREMLAPETLPETTTPAKLAALEVAAAAFGREAERVPLHIAFKDKVNRAGVRQAACTLCGDCMGGCNVGAKTTVHSTYLTDAAAYGAAIFTGLKVRFVERAAGGLWRVSFVMHTASDKVVPIRSVQAPIVILAAGTFGSNEILFRSRARGLALSDQLGKRISTNADAIAFGYNNDRPIGAVGVGNPPKEGVPRPGPAVSGLIDLRRRRDPADRLAIVEASIQSAMARVLPLMLPAGAVLGTDTDKGLNDLLAELKRTGESLVGGAYKGAVNNTQVFLAVGHDSGRGEMVLDGDHVTIRWPDALSEPVFQRIEVALTKAVKATGGTYVANPVSKSFLGGNLFTVHPLGGAGMGESRDTGVVDHMCRVFDAGSSQGRDAVHDGLFVCDGAVMPCSLGVHPLLTITAVAERAMLLLAKVRGLTLDVGSVKADAKAAALVPGAVAEAARPRAGLLSRWRT